MTDEALINRLYDIVDEITRIGGEQERTSITPGILVADANPSDLPAGYIKIVNPRDSTYVPCLTISGLVVSDNDLVNVLFTKGTEPIALSQSANSPSNTLKVSEVWESDFDAVALESDASGNIGIGTSGPDARLDILDTSGAQLRLTFEDGVKFADFTLDTNHDLTIKPSSTGQIKLQPTTDSTDFFQILDADGGDSVFNVDSTNERVTAGAANDSNSTSKFNVISDGSDLTQTVSRYNTDGAGAGIVFQKSRGSLASPTTVVNGDFSAGFESRGYNGTSFQPNASIAFKTVGTISASSMPGEMRFSTTPVGSNSLSVRAIILNDGSVGIGTTTPKHPLQVFGVLKVGGDAGQQLGTVALGNDATTTLNVGIFRTATGGGLGGGNYLGLGGFDGIRFTASNTQIGSQTEWMRLTTGGLFGINGVTSPSTELDIGAGAIEFEEMTAPAAGAANTARDYAEDDGSGNTRRRIKFSSGNAVTIAVDGGLATYTPTNVVTDRSYDANATSVAELADVLGTLIADFQAAGVLG